MNATPATPKGPTMLTAPTLHRIAADGMPVPTITHDVAAVIAACPTCAYSTSADTAEEAADAIRRHYLAAYRAEDVAAQAASLGLPDPMPLLDNVAAELYAQLDELSDTTVILAYEDTGDDRLQLVLHAIADDLRETLRATLDVRISDYLADLDLAAIVRTFDAG